MDSVKVKLSDIKPVKAWGWLYREPRVLSHGDVTSFEKTESGNTNADQVPVVLMTAAAFAKLKRELTALRIANHCHERMNLKLRRSKGR